jgi:hypothetical protein
VVACSGIAPAILLVWDTVRRSRRALSSARHRYRGLHRLALLLDAAIHGWDDLKLLPSAIGRIFERQPGRMVR